MIRNLLVFVFLIIAAPLRADAPGDILDGVSERGQARFDFLDRPFFAATLYTPDAQPLDWDKPLGLLLEYDRWFAGGLLVYSSMFEMNRIEGAQADHPDIRKQLRTCFKTVRKGDSYLAYAHQPDAIKFWRNGQLTCTLQADRIAERFLSIWLSDMARDPELAMILRGDDQG